MVLFYPDNIDIIKGGPAERRKFLDIMISQLRPNYIHLLNRISENIRTKKYISKTNKV